MNIFKRIGQFFVGLFTKRSKRIVFAKDVAKAMLSFSQDTTAVNIITYVLDTIAPASKPATTIATRFLTEASPVLFKAFDLMDASDNTEITEDNITSVCNEFNALGQKANEEQLKAMVTKFIDNDGKLSFMEALTIIEMYK